MADDSEAYKLHKLLEKYINYFRRHLDDPDSEVARDELENAEAILPKIFSLEDLIGYHGFSKKIAEEIRSAYKKNAVVKDLLNEERQKVIEKLKRDLEFEFKFERGPFSLKQLAPIFDKIYDRIIDGR